MYYKFLSLTTKSIAFDVIIVRKIVIAPQQQAWTLLII